MRVPIRLPPRGDPRYIVGMLRDLLGALFVENETRGEALKTCVLMLVLGVILAGAAWWLLDASLAIHEGYEEISGSLSRRRRRGGGLPALMLLGGGVFGFVSLFLLVGAPITLFRVKKRP